MHDWTLTTIVYEWEAAKAILSFDGPEGRSAAVTAEGVSLLQIPHANEWGPSASVNEVRGPNKLGDRQRLEIEMQSGDVLSIMAKSILVPDEANRRASMLEATGNGKSP